MLLAAQPVADRQQIEALIAKYAKSIDAADPALAAEIWSQSPDVSFIHPQGHEHGFAQIRQNVYLKAMGGTFSERRLTIKDVAIRVYRDTAWAEFNWNFAGRLKTTAHRTTKAGRPRSTERNGAAGAGPRTLFRDAVIEGLSS